MPRKINEKGSRPIKNKSGIVTHQEETVLKTIKPKKIKFLVMSYSCRKTLNFDDEKNKHT